MGFQAKMAQVNDIRQTLSSQNLLTLKYGLFKILTPDEKSYGDFENKPSANGLKDSEIEEIRTLQHLEDCANATRGTEAYDQYEWLNESDE